MQLLISVLLLQDTHEFDLHFDKIFKWFAINLQERQNFLIVLWKVGYYFMLIEQYKGFTAVTTVS
jgi:hypothetical protein